MEFFNLDRAKLLLVKSCLETGATDRCVRAPFVCLRFSSSFVNGVQYSLDDPNNSLAKFLARGRFYPVGYATGSLCSTPGHIKYVVSYTIHDLSRLQSKFFFHSILPSQLYNNLIIGKLIFEFQIQFSQHAWRVGIHALSRPGHLV